MTTKDKKSAEENIHHYPYSIETRMALVESSILNINQTLMRIEVDLKEFRSEMKSEMKDVRSEMKDIRAEMKSDFRWLLSITGALYATLAGIMAHGFHWF
jgi:hypothetical protein